MKKSVFCFEGNATLFSRSQCQICRGSNSIHMNRLVCMRRKICKEKEKVDVRTALKTIKHKQHIDICVAFGQVSRKHRHNLTYIDTYTFYNVTSTFTQQKQFQRLFFGSNWRDASIRQCSMHAKKSYAII